MRETYLKWSKLEGSYYCYLVLHNGKLEISKNDVEMFCKQVDTFFLSSLPYLTTNTYLFQDLLMVQTPRN